MIMNKESVVDLTNALTEMARNSFVDEMMPIAITVLVRCNDCDSFHLHTYNAEELMQSIDLPTIIATSIFSSEDSGGSEIIISACKSIGSQLAALDKEVLAVTMLASGGRVEIDKNLEAGKTEEEIRKMVMKSVTSGSEEDGIKLQSNIIISTFALPDINYCITYNIETVGNDDVLLVDRKEDDEQYEGNLYEAHKTLLNSATFLSRVGGAAKIKTCATVEATPETVLSGENEAKFRSLVSRIELSLKVEDVI